MRRPGFIRGNAMNDKKCSRFREGILLLDDADETSKGLLKKKIRQEFWNLSEDERNAILGEEIWWFLRRGPVMGPRRRPTVSNDTRAFLMRLMFEQGNGVSVWEAVNKELNMCELMVLGELLEQRPDKFSAQCLREMSNTLKVRVKNGLALGETRIGTKPTDILEENVVAQFQARLTQVMVEHYLTAEGPRFGASFEAEKAALEGDLQIAGIAKETIPALEKANEYLTQPRDDFSFKQAMELCRTCFETVIQDQATACGVKPGRTGGQTLQILKDKAKITEHECNLGKSIYSFVSERGSHALDSEEVEAKLSLFMVMEYCQYLVRRLGKQATSDVR